MTRLGIAIAASGFLLASAGAVAAQSGVAARSEGPMLYKQYCATCHGLARTDKPFAADWGSRTCVSATCHTGGLPQ